MNAKDDVIRSRNRYIKLKIVIEQDSIIMTVRHSLNYFSGSVSNLEFNH